MTALIARSFSRIRLLGFILLIASAACIVGCDGSAADGNAAGGKCTADAECPSDSYCDTGSGVCIVTALACDEMHPCPLGLICDLESLFCIENPDGPCPDGQVVVGDQCIVPECTEDVDCPGLQKCNTDIYRCEQPAFIDCEEAIDCPVPQICKNGRCSFCIQDTDCRSDERCLVTMNAEPSCEKIVCHHNDNCRDGWWCRISTSLCEPPCTSHDDCETGYACYSGLCEEIIPECEDDWDCEERKICTERKLCEEGASCSDDEACGEERICSGSPARCIPDGCLADSECPGGQLCDPIRHKCLFAVPTGNPCAHSEQCLASDICHDYTCRRLCDPLTSSCEAPTVCGVTNNVDSGWMGICLEPNDGVGLGENCGPALACETDLICHNYKCREICNPEAEDTVCPAELFCEALAEYGFGICITPPCDPLSNPCTGGEVCYLGECVRCATDDHCPDRHYCDAGECVVGCLVTGCPEENTFCDYNSGRCEGLCFPACDRGYICMEGECIPNFCDPPCLPPAVCDDGRCVAPPDCRESGCPNPLWLCNYDTGECREPDCPECQSWQCCNELTDYQCSDICYTCSEEEPAGTCPLGRTCLNGQCIEIPCVDEGEACGMVAETPGTPCCEGLVCCEVFPGSGGQCCVDCNPDGSCVEVE